MLNNLQLGYACINMALREKGIYTSRTIINKNFSLERANLLAASNLADLMTILVWNVNHNFKLFRISSNLFPRWEKYKLADLPAYLAFLEMLGAIGQFIQQNNLRVSFHPDHFVKLAAINPKLLEASLQEVERHSQLFDLMGFAPSVFNKINIHVGGAYDDKIEATKRFCKSFFALSPNAQKRLTIENDDKVALFSVKDLYERIYLSTGIPIVFDMHHHQFNTGGLSQQEAFEMAYATWPKDIVPVFHYSESKYPNKAAHADYIETDQIENYGKPLCVIVEAKAKELAVLKYLEKQKVLA